MEEQSLQREKLKSAKKFTWKTVTVSISYLFDQLLIVYFFQSIPELEDLSHQTEARNNLDHLCRSIEKESWALLDNNDGISTFSKKYNSHIRALVLNISDKSNGDFFRDVLLGKMTPLEIAHLKVRFRFKRNS